MGTFVGANRIIAAWGHVRTLSQREHRVNGRMIHDSYFASAARVRKSWRSRARLSCTPLRFVSRRSRRARGHGWPPFCHAVRTPHGNSRTPRERRGTNPQPRHLRTARHTPTVAYGRTQFAQPQNSHWCTRCGIASSSSTCCDPHHSHCISNGTDSSAGTSRGLARNVMHQCRVRLTSRPC